MFTPFKLIGKDEGGELPFGRGARLVAHETRATSQHRDDVFHGAHLGSLGSRR
jgi:hypothetical protein